MTRTQPRRRYAGPASAVAAVLALTAPVAAQCPVDRVLADETLAGDQLGDAAAMSGGIAVVGASRHDFLGSSSGAAFVFSYGPDATGRSRWGQEARLVAEAGAANDLFGDAVAIDAAAASGPTIVVGAYLDDNVNGNAAGAAYVYGASMVGEQRQWSHAQTLLAPDGSDDDQFGEAVAVRGDLLAVGAPRHDGTALNAGAVYVYRHTGATWSYETTLEIPESAEHDLFGVALAIGTDTILVGAAFSDHAGINSGVAYAFRYEGSAWSAGELIVPEDPAAQDKFGESIALRGNFALFGAAFDDDDGANAGSVYVFRFDGAWSQQQKLTASDAETDARFGTSVGFSDGVEDGLAIIGAPRASAGGIDSGKAYLYTFDGVDWIESTTLLPGEGANNDQFGQSVAIGDQFILIGANLDDDDSAGANAGSAHFFTTGLEDLVDCNNNDVSDFCDLASGDSLDCNFNGIPDECDLADGTSRDDNENGIPDECDDCNENGVRDDLDVMDGTSEDCNENGIPDECEIDVAQGEGYFCTTDCDPDCNENGIPDACDVADGTDDCNSNGIPDSCDIADGTSEDCDANGIPDSCDVAGGIGDCNANGIPDSCDIAEGTSEDEDEDGIPDECFSDCNNNGVADALDIETGTSEDCNENLIPDECDVDPTDPDENGEVSLDLNDDGIPDECQDCNGNMIPDFFEIAGNPDLDCNENGTIDDCEIPVEHGEPGEYHCTEECNPDCNMNGIPDDCDIAEGTVEDCDENGIPDECDEDCNENGVPDGCDIADGTSEDINGNGIPDECEDCNQNGTVDTEDVTTGTSEDCNGNLIPDECEIPVEQSGEGVEYFCTEDCDEDCNENGIPDSCDLEEPNNDLNDNGILDECEPDCNDNGFPDFLEILWGLVDDENDNGIPDECECPDLDGDGIVGFAEVLLILAAWGDAGGIEDVDGDGVVGFGDVLTILAAWGVCK